MQLRVGPASALEPGGRITATGPAGRVVVFNLDGELHALAASCIHRDGPLEDGVVSDGVVTCPWHLHRYNIRDGQRVDLPGVSQAVYPVDVQDGEVTVEIPDPQPEQSIRDVLLDHARKWKRDG